MTHPSPTTAKTEPEAEAVKVPAHVLESLSSADIAELVRLFNSGEPEERAKAFAWADNDCRNHWRNEDDRRR
jgi:hypothetical protein